MFSIIVPVYKSEKYLRECIDSILAQTCGEFELILVDDGSPDTCPRICDEYALRDSRIKVVHKPNGGSVSARKAGVQAASGEYLCFADGDDFILPDMLERYKTALEHSDADVLCAGYIEYSGDAPAAQVRPKIPAGIYDKAALRERIYPEMLSQGRFFGFGIVPSLCCKCFRTEPCRRVMESVPEALSLGDDAAVTYPCLLEAGLVQVLDYCGYCYRQNPESMTHSYDGRLYGRLRELALHMQAVAQKYGGNLGKQTDEYTAYLFILAKNNELRYRKDGSFLQRRRALTEYLRDEALLSPLRRVKIRPSGMLLTLLCMRLRLLLPVYIYEKLRHIGRG